MSGGESECTKAMERTQTAMRSQASMQSSRESPATFLRTKSPLHGENRCDGILYVTQESLTTSLLVESDAKLFLLVAAGQTWIPAPIPIRFLNLIKTLLFID